MAWKLVLLERDSFHLEETFFWFEIGKKYCALLLKKIRNKKQNEYNLVIFALFSNIRLAMIKFFPCKGETLA